MMFVVLLHGHEGDNRDSEQSVSGVFEPESIRKNPEMAQKEKGGCYFRGQVSCLKPNFDLSGKKREYKPQ